MINEKKIKPLEELNLLDGFLFDVVSEDKQNYQDILEIILGREVLLSDNVQTEKAFQYMPEICSIRMDVVAQDEEKTFYNAEMQGRNTGNLLKRERYYQAHLDVSLIKPGEVVP